MTNEDFYHDDEFAESDLDDELLGDFEPEPDELDQISRMNDDARKDLAVKILEQVSESVSVALSLLRGGEMDDGAQALARLVRSKSEAGAKAREMTGARSLEGVFDGQHMVGSDGKTYPVPPNYASKSKLVEGDMLKLTILRDGTFVFKQIGPVERDRVVGELAMDPESGQYMVSSSGKHYHVLTASVTFYRGEPGDECVVLVPKSGSSNWGAIENIIKG